MAKKKGIDLFGDDEDASRSPSEFEALLNGSSALTRRLVPGDRFQGEVLAVSGQEAFLSTGTPTDAMMPLLQMNEEEKPKVGDLLDVVVVRSSDSEILVKRFGSKGLNLDADSLEEAFKMEIPVEGVVSEVIKGGFRVKVQEQKAFCPLSQMDFHVTRPEDYVGRKFSFMITKFERGRDLVVSRRQLLNAERQQKEADFLKTDQVGEIFSGQIFRIEKYGAFVRLENGIEGLIPISELSWGRIHHPQEVVNLDQSVQVKLLRAEVSEGRLKASFSLKQGGNVLDPWVSIAGDYPVGKTFEGRVENKQNFGLFINLAPGVTGLLPRSAWREAQGDVNYENLNKGDVVQVKISNIDQDAHKMSFAVPGSDDEGDWQEHQKSLNKQNSGSFGSGQFGSLADAFKGLKPRG